MIRLGAIAIVVAALGCETTSGPLPIRSGGSGHTHDGPFIAVGVRQNHSCALTEGGVPTCWGRVRGPEDQMHRPPTDVPFVSLSSGAKYACGLRKDASIACFGLCYSGQCDAPTGTFIDVAAGQEGAACAIDTAGSVQCWGEIVRTFGEAPTAAMKRISVGPSFACAITQRGEVRCWGQRGTWKRFEGKTLDTTTELYGAAPKGTFVDIATGGAHACAVRDTGELSCWGDNSKGQSTPPPGSFKAVSADHEHTCALTREGKAACWGYTFGAGQVAAPPGTVFDTISTGLAHACGLQAGGAVVCWGRDRLGQVKGSGPGLVPAPGKGKPPRSPT